MLPTRSYRPTLLAAALVAVAACSSDSDDVDDLPTDGGTDPTDQMDPTDNEEDDNEDDDEIAVIDRSTSTPAYLTSECGSLPVLETPISTDAGAGATLVEGQLVAGRLEDDVAHYWDIELVPGFYHVVLDGAQGDDRDLNIGVTLTDLTALDDDDASLLDDSDTGYRSRRAAFIEVPEARTVRLQLEQRFLAEDYVLGVFPNGSDVPSPRFDDCPDIMPLSLGTTQSVQITELNAEEAFVWYRADLDAGEYAVSVTAAQNGTSDGVVYEVFLLDEFGQIGESSESVLLDVDATGGSSSDTATFTRDTDGPVWLRLEENGGGLNIEFTLNATGEN